MVLYLRELYFTSILSGLYILTARFSRWTYIQADAPRYKTGHSINFGGQIVVFFLSIFGILYCLYENKARIAGKRDHRLDGLTEEEQDALGNRHPQYRYWI